MKTVSEISNYNGQFQKPLNSGFNAKSTASEVIKGIDLTGKTAIVTGGNAGIGLETTKVLAAAGALVMRRVSVALYAFIGKPISDWRNYDLMVIGTYFDKLQ